MNPLILPLAIAFVIFVWLKSDAFVDFLGWFLKPFNLFYVRDYSQSNLPVEYPLWLYLTHGNFLTKLITCPLCLSFWTNLIFARSLIEWLSNSCLTLLIFCLLNKLYPNK
jgi:hypothetical protein